MVKGWAGQRSGVAGIVKSEGLSEAIFFCYFFFTFFPLHF